MLARTTKPAKTITLNHIGLSVQLVGTVVWGLIVIHSVKTNTEKKVKKILDKF